MSESREPAAPVTARRQETRGRLFDAAMQVFAELGLPGASVESICAKAGFSRGAFYSNFSSKEQLFLALLEREFARQAVELAQKAKDLEPEIREGAGGLTSQEAARYVVEFLTPSADHEIWFALELELLLLALRDPEIVTERFDIKERLYREIAGSVEQIVATAGRTFTIPVEHALPALGGLHEDALRIAVMGGPGLGEALDTLGERITELLFALTEPIGDHGARHDGLLRDLREQ